MEIKNKDWVEGRQSKRKGIVVNIDILEVDWKLKGTNLSHSKANLLGVRAEGIIDNLILICKDCHKSNCPSIRTE